MAKQTTNRYKTLHKLSIDQQNAIDLLVQGKTDQETADEAGVHRVTVTKWRNYHPAFQAALNQRRKDLWAESVDQLRGLLPKALQVLANKLDDDKASVQAALAILKLSGLGRDGKSSLGEYLVGETESRSVVEQLVERRRREQDLRLFRTADTLYGDKVEEEVLGELTEHLAEDDDRSAQARLN